MHTHPTADLHLWNECIVTDFIPAIESDQSDHCHIE
jgi:hypothetical protein